MKFLEEFKWYSTGDRYFKAGPVQITYDVKESQYIEANYLEEHVYSCTFKSRIVIDPGYSDFAKRAHAKVVKDSLREALIGEYRESFLEVLSMCYNDREIYDELNKLYQRMYYE